MPSNASRVRSALKIRSEERRVFERTVDTMVEIVAPGPEAHICRYGHYAEGALKRISTAYATPEAEVDDVLRRDKLADLYCIVREGLLVSEPSYPLKNLGFIDER